ncbi:MAG: DUF5913 domain-containing protein, partial [Myxococcales bacterium]|nr:DUF5913 domain-containing protein [Myxococcales bacterium]
CHGARVNGVMVGLRQELHNGDVVEILTRGDQKPSKDWLDFVATGRARSRIRAFLRTEERKKGVKLGRDVFEREMHRRDLSFSRYIKSGQIEKALRRFGANSADELFAQVGFGKLSVPHLMEFVDPQEPETRESLRPGLFERTVRKVTGKDKKDGICIEGVDDILVRFAKCCTPVAGDSIVGWITRGRGVTVHRRGCSKAMELDPARRIEVSWADHSNVDLPVSLRVTTRDRPGILTRISGVFTDNGVNIQEATCRSADGRAINTFQFTVCDLTRLRSVMRGISKVDGVQDVERV